MSDESKTVAGRSAVVLHMSALGEAVFALPLLHALKHADPPFRVTSVASAVSGPILEASGLADRVLLRKSLKGLPGFRGLLREVRATRPEVALALSPAAGSRLLSWLSGARLRAGHYGGGLPWLVHTVPYEGGGIENYLSLLPPLGVPRTVSSYLGLLQVSDRAQRTAEELLASVGIGAGDPFVAVSPISTGKVDGKAYPDESWAEVCRELHDRGRRPVLIGSPADRAAHARFAASAGRDLVSLAGQTTPPVLAGVLRRAACVVGVDTGPIHVAAAVGTRCVVIFGPSDPRRTAPCGEGHIVLSAGLDCQPCLDRPCPRRGECLRLVRPEQVVAAVESVIRRS